jgi:hypothetical protein
MDQTKNARPSTSDHDIVHMLLLLCCMMRFAAEVLGFLILSIPILLLVCVFGESTNDPYDSF